MFTDKKTTIKTPINTDLVNRFSILFEIDEIDVNVPESDCSPEMKVKLKGLRIRQQTDLTEVGLPVFIAFVQGYVDTYLEMIKGFFSSTTNDKE